ncbi:MAG: hypothetical protein LBJ17_00895 [Dysgonamonadaceae bacterium]|jgi:hypothetical protein|nr:hypothetical protein [Dysgonamonadaceae bacterium]
MNQDRLSKSHEKRCKLAEKIFRNLTGELRIKSGLTAGTTVAFGLFLSVCVYLKIYTNFATLKS